VTGALSVTWRFSPSRNRRAASAAKVPAVLGSARVTGASLPEPGDALKVLSGVLRSFAEATTDYGTLVDVVARQLAEVVKDGCVVRLLGDDGWLEPVAIHMPIEHRVHDRETVARLRAHMARPHHMSAQDSARRVLESGEPLLVSKLDLTALRETAAPEITLAYETIGIHSLLLVPLRLRGESIGLLALVRFESTSPPFAEQDQDLAQALADHAALAISNARLLQSALRELAERKRAEAALHRSEEQLRQAQKMEAIGRLAGSIAHDFNNLLSVILSYASLMLGEIKAVDPLRADLEAIKKAGEKAAELTTQLLAFSRQQVLLPRVLDLNEVLVESERMLRRLLGEDIELVIHHGRNLSRVRGDPGQVDQVVLNLAINARDAMPDGGKLTIETRDVTLDESYHSEHFEAGVGPHVMLAVSDTGIGMDKQTQARIFEPFFTTKELGKGTGLGLSTVFGIVKQSGGNIWVYSELHAGTTFKIYLPVVEDSDVELPEPPLPTTLDGTETILLVEDQDDVRKVAHAILRKFGYHVIEARNAGEALLSCERHPRTIHLLLTDVVMPQMSGRELAERLLRVRPDMKVLYMSGYTENAIVHHGILDSGIAYLQKPIVPDALARRVREVLDARARHRSAAP
jgi:two-component system cell cycle sensor histidine kinase/response regulator CckA